jgi:tRNA A37 threonylcarbamoyladenosine dehydratase
MKEITPSLRKRLERQIELIGEEKTLKLLNSSVMLIGLGGVGGYVCEMLARMGIGRLFLVDCDTVSESNLNRQIIALTDTVGKNKTDVMQSRVLQINPECSITSENVFVTKENADGLIEKSGADIIIDAIDNVSAKVAIINSGIQRGKYVFSAMGAGNKLKISGFKVADISKTSMCGLARAVRRELREKGIEHLDVLFSDEPVIQSGKRTPASIAYMPSAAGLMIAEHIFRKITEAP